MRKKIASLALALMLVPTLAMGESETLSIADMPLPQIENLELNLDGIEERALSLFNTGTSDVVSVTGDEYHVQTDGVKLDLIAPFGSTVLTQSVDAQLATYLTVTDDPLRIGKMLVDKGWNIVAIDNLTRAEAHVLVRNDNLANIVHDLGSLSTADQLRYQEQLVSCYEAQSGEMIAYNNNVYYILNFPDAVYYITVVNDRSVYMICQEDESVMESVRMFMDDMAYGMNVSAM